MNLKLLVAFFFGGLIAANAQFTVKGADGNIFHDGDIFEFGTTSYPEAELLFFVTNTGSQDIFSRIEYISNTNAEDPLFEQLCYGVECYFGIALGGTVPPRSTDAVQITPGETTGLGNHFFSDDEGDGQGNVDFVFQFKLYEDISSTTEVGETLMITYRYNPSLGVDAVKKVDLSLLTTVVSERLLVDVKEPVTATIYDLQGKLIKQLNLEVGNQEINVSDLSAQMYLINFRNAAGAGKTSKFVVQ